MDIQKINNTIAEIVGYKNIRQEWIIGVEDEDNCGMDCLQWYGSYNNWDRTPIPDYWHRIGAISKAEEIFAPSVEERDMCYGKWIEYAENLCKVCGYDEEERVRFSWVVFRATSEQRAKALLITANKWDELYEK